MDAILKSQAEQLAREMATHVIGKHLGISPGSTCCCRREERHCDGRLTGTETRGSEKPTRRTMNVGNRARSHTEYCE